MLEARKLIVQNWATWGKATVEFEPGLSFLRGRSKDAGGNPNMAGKSTLMNAMYALVHGDHQLAVKKRSLKSITNNDTAIRLLGRQDKRKIDVSLSDGRLSLKLDGVDQQLHKQPAARASVADLIGIPPELWSATVHVNGIESNPLIRGTGAQRCQFLENAFDLNRWSDKYTAVGSAISALKRAKEDLDETQAELARLVVPTDTVADLKKSLEECEGVANKLAERARKIERQVASLETLPEPPPREVAHYERTVEILTKKVRRVEQDARAYRQYVGQVETHKKYRDRVVRLKGEIKYGSNRSTEEIEDELRDVRQSIADHDAYKRAVPRVKRWRDLAEKIADAHGIEFADLNELRALSSAWIAALKPGAKNCPVCGSKFKGTVDREALEELREAQDDLPSKIVKPKGDLKRLLKHRDDLADELRSTRIAERARRELRDLEKVEEPERVAKPSDDVSELAERLSREKVLLSAAQSWEKSGLSPKLRNKLGELKSHLKKLSKSREETSDKIAELRELLSRARIAMAKRDQLKERIDKLERELALHPIYKALQSAYSPSGLRLMRLFEIMEAIVANLNSGSYTLRDRLVFGYKLTKNRDLAITASNVRGTFDVRYMSGAELRMFCVNLLLTMLPLLPSNRRTNFLILDEAEANMSSQSRAIFASEYIPRLLEVVPTLWVLTPCTRQEFAVPGSREFVAVKHNTTSKLVEA